MAGSIDTTQIDAQVQHVRRAAAELENVSKRDLIRAIVKLTIKAKSIVHVQTGLLRRSLHPEGVFKVGNGLLEAHVNPMPASYAVQEVARGGSHDYVTRTINEGSDILDELQQDLERDIAGLF